MEKFPYPRPSVSTGITSEHLKIIDDKVQWRKSVLRRDYEAKQRDYSQKRTSYEKRIRDFAERREMENIARIEKNKARLDDFLLHANQFNDSMYYEKLNFIASLKNRDEKKLSHMAKLKRIKQSTKRENQSKRHCALIDKQKRTIEENKFMMDVCIKHKPPVVKNVSKTNTNKNDTGIKGEVLPDQCPYTQKYNIEDGVKFANSNSSFRDKLLDRMKMLKMNFNTCEQGIAFWNKTKPLWNRLTQCLKESHSLIEIAEPTTESRQISEAYAYKHVENIQTLDSIVDFVPRTSFMQQIMMTDFNYNISDDVVIKTMQASTAMLQSTSSAADVLKLTRCIVEHDADVNGIVHYMLFGIIQRAAFEFMKIETAKKIFVQGRYIVDRLQHVNDKGIVPRNFLISKNKDMVKKIVLKMINNNKRFAKFDRPFVDEPAYMSLVSETAADRMSNHLVEHGAQDIKRCFPLTSRDKVLESLDEAIGVILKLAYAKIAHYVAYAKPTKINDVSGRTPTITMMMVYRISRKIVKLQLEMFSSDKRALHYLAKTTNSFKEMILKKVPVVQYGIREYQKAEKMDLDAFLNSFDR